MCSVVEESMDGGRLTFGSGMMMMMKKKKKKKKGNISETGDGWD